MSEDVKFGIGAQDVGFGATVNAAEVKAREAAEHIKASFESINATFEKVQGAFIAFTAVLAGGEAFKEMIGSAVSATVSSVAMGKQFGISTTAASQLKVALDATHVTQEQLTAGNQKITMALNKNEGAFKSLGVATRETNGDYRNALEIQLDVNEALMKVKAGTDRNVEGVKIYGKGWLDAQESLRLTRKAMEEAKEKADALGLTVGTENVVAVGKYRDALVDSHDVMEALGKVVAESLLPFLTSMGEWMKDHGPAAVHVMRIAVQFLGDTFSAMWDTVKTVLGGLWTILASTGTAIMSLFGQSSQSTTAMEFFTNVLRAISLAFIAVGTVVQVAVDAIVDLVERLAGGFMRLTHTAGAIWDVLAGNGKWSDVVAAWDKGTKEIEKKAREHEDNMGRIVAKGLADADHAMLDEAGAKPTVTDTPDAAGGNKSTGSAAKIANLMTELTAELAAKKAKWDEEQAVKGSFVQFSLEQEKAFWDAAKDRAKDGSTNLIEIEKNSNKLKSAIAKQAYTDELAGLKETEGQYKNNLQAKLAIAIEMAQKISIAEGASAPAARKAGAEVLAITREITAQRLAIDEAYIKATDTLELSRIDTAEREADLENQLGKITDAELIAEERKFEDQRYQLKVEALAKKLKLLAQDPTENVAKIQAANNEKLQLDIAHSAQLDKLRIKSVAEANKDYKGLFSSMQSGFQSTITGFLNGTATLASTVKGLFKNIADAIIGVIAQMAAEWLVMQIKTLIMGKATAVSQITANAGIAATAAMASVAAIPFYGWAMAPEVGAATFAGAMAYNASASAERGYDIPAGVNPTINAHEREMVLPQKHADVIRNIADGGGSAGQTFSPTIQVTTLDGPSFAKWMNQNAGAVSASLKKLNSRFMAPS